MPMSHAWNACYPFITADTHVLLAINSSQLTLMHSVLFIGYSLHPCDAYFSLAIVYTNTMLVLHQPLCRDLQYVIQVLKHLLLTLYM